jgi:hypothetical protein
MRLFQNSGLYPSYLPRLNELSRQTPRFDARVRAFLDDRFGNMHFLLPVLERDPDAFFTNGDDKILQHYWAREQGMPGRPSLESILLAQIEHHRAEVFYNLDPVRYPSSFVRKLPGCVRKTLCWRAAPSKDADLRAYGAVVGNFPSILETWRKQGCRAESFIPAVDPLMAEFARRDRPIDVLFVGGYTRNHRHRAKILEQVASLAGRVRVMFRLDSSRLTRLAESPVGRLLPMRKHRRPPAIARIAESPIFGLELYELLGSAKIVLNGAIDMAGEDRGNMRCFEAMACGAMLLSDDGNYPEGMTRGQTMEVYQTGEQAVDQILKSLENWPRSAEMAARGQQVITQIYDKVSQWKRFTELAS